MKKKLGFLLLLFLVIIFPIKGQALNEVNIYFFYSDDCKICSQEKAYLEALKDRYFNIRVYSYNISSDVNYNLMIEAKALYNVKESGIPFTVIGDSTLLGFSQSKKCTMEKKIYEYSYHAYDNKLGTSLLNISYRNDLVGDVKEYNDNSDYVIEEGSNNVTNQEPVNKEENGFNSIWSNDKYKASIILCSGGLLLGIIVLILGLKERKRRI